jgi:glycosyltransferase involved in cell wall biosynthesis
MDSAPAISILTPVWNGLPFIKECVASVLSQGFQDWEMLIGDNGSTDGTREYLRTLTDPRIRVYLHKSNLEISGNLNFLFSKARTEIAYILCADDYFVKDGLQRVIDEWNSSRQTVSFICFKPDQGRSKFRRYSYQALPKLIPSNHSRLAFFLFGNFTGNISNVSVKVHDVNSTGGFVKHLKTAQDFEMWCRLSKKKDVVISEKEVVFTRQHPGSATFYMTRRGDDYGQLVSVYEDLIEQLSPHCDRSKLIRFFNTQIPPQYFRTAIKYAFLKNVVFMKSVLNQKSSILWPIWLQLLICFPLALSENFREYISRLQAQKLWSSRNDHD